MPGVSWAEALRDLHPQILEEGLEQEFNSLQAQSEAARPIFRQPASRGLGIGQNPLRRRRVLGVAHAAACTATAACRHPGEADRYQSSVLQGRPG